MNQRTRITLFTPLMACSIALGTAATGWAATPAVTSAAPAAPAAAQCFVEAKAGDATKSIVTGEGFDKAKGKVFLDQTDGAGGGTATVGDDDKFTSGRAGRQVQGLPERRCQHRLPGRRGGPGRGQPEADQFRAAAPFEAALKRYCTD
ncbi:hypothetical protein [Streptomyces sp. A1136]|uniref:hypothetical protein n=1 Tax=Streptomyces sp. A1136 TaxID=2563102 RepID=UPI00109EBC6F|nr:hypothetical protein [Streptomyces sp. A1136]THA48126.1 hypothetical protein E6R62_29540 [Streptomyces sp. A1136]